MPNFDNWMGTEQTGLTFDPDSIIKRDEVELVISRGSTDLTAQCCRVVPSAMGSQKGETQANNTPGQGDVVVIGDAKLNIKKGDLFTFRSTVYKVVYVNLGIPGQVQAVAEGVQ